MPLQPSVPLPAPLRGREIGSFAHATVTDRMPATVRRVLAENAFPPEITTRLDELLADLPNGTIRPLRDIVAPDVEQWEAYVAPYEGHSWLDVPWFFAETYFFRRILEATGYFTSGPGYGVDPFSYQKRTGLKVSRDDIRLLARQHAEGLIAGRLDPEKLRFFLYADLWGNQADLNLWPADEDGRPRHSDAAAAYEHLLADDTSLVLEHLTRHRSRQIRVDVIVDNAGFEFVCDLVLADFLLSSEAVREVNLHVKAHPTFISDVTVPDVRSTLSFLRADGDSDVHALGNRLQESLDRGQLCLYDDYFWTSPLNGWEMQEALWNELSHSDLLISKGDANYRRWLGDRHWPFDTPFAEIVSYVPAPLVTLRTLKSEVAAGIHPSRLGELSARDPEWLVNGKWGVIQFVRPTRVQR